MMSWRKNLSYEKRDVELKRHYHHAALLQTPCCSSLVLWEATASVHADNNSLKVDQTVAPTLISHSGFIFNNVPAALHEDGRGR